MTKQISRDVWLAALLFATLAVILFFSLTRQQKQDLAPPLAADSSQPDGGRALLLWMEELGYAVDSSVAVDFAVPDETELLLVLEPSLTMRPQDAEVLDAWVAEGGTLIIVGTSLQMMSWARHFRAALSPVSPAEMTEITSTLTIQTPLWNSPSQSEFPHRANADNTLSTSRMEDGYIVHAANQRGPALLSFERGEGRVVLSTTIYPFTNEGLQQAGNPEFVLNVLALGGVPGRVWYDDWHHGLRPSAVARGVGFSAWLRTSTAGRSLLLAGAIIFVALALRGRSFGRPIPLPAQRTRRTPMEYVTAMANLHRRAHHRSALLQDYHNRLKRDYARRYRLSPAQPDGEFVAQIAIHDPAVDREALERLLAALSNPHASEEQTVQLAAAAVDWIENRPSHRKGPSHAN